MLIRYLGLAAVAFTLIHPAWAQTKPSTPGCSTILDTLCLPELIKTRRPFQGPDFVVNEIDLASAGHLAIYQGIGLAEQSGVTGITKQKSYGSGETGADVYVGSSTNGRYFDVHYRLAGMYGVVQIFGYLASAQEAQSAGKFIASIKICTHWPAPCTPSRPLVDAGNAVAKLQ